MEAIINLITTNLFTPVGIGAFACGVALFYLVMRRTMKRRQETSEF